MKTIVSHYSPRERELALRVAIAARFRLPLVFLCSLIMSGVSSLEFFTWLAL